MTLTIDEQPITLPAPVQAALVADARAAGRPVADVLADRLTTLYTGAMNDGAGLAEAPDSAPERAEQTLRGLHSYGLLAGAGLTTAALLAERQAEVEREYGPAEDKAA